jgi:excinuclease ABC subunit B
MFILKSRFNPTGDQPRAIKTIVENFKKGAKRQILLGVTGSGKTMTMAKVIEKTQKPALVIGPNKTLCAQLYQEFKDFFPDNAVHYFVSYYDYYQPEAYIPQTDTYIEKDAKINETIDRLRHAAIQDLLTRKDVIVVASVSCIYNIGSPEYYRQISVDLKTGQKMERSRLLSALASLQYKRSDIEFGPGSFRARGNIVDVHLVTGEEILRIELWQDRIERISSFPPSLEPGKESVKSQCRIFPASFWVTPQEEINIAAENIRNELEERLQELEKEGKLLEAQRLQERTNYDLELLKETGYCHGVENYSRHLEFRKPGQPPYSLLEYFPASGKEKDFLTFIDESHLTIPQIKAMSVQDRMRKQMLIEYGFRLPSAVDNRPLTFEEFKERAPKVICVSATPGKFESEYFLKETEGKNAKSRIVEQLVRPTGLLEPSVEIRKTERQITDLVEEIKARMAKNQKALVITLTKKLAEALSDHLTEQGIKTKWLHSEIKTLERPGILAGLRKGEYDALVGINLLREGLDLPEVSLVAILDADKEGFLRNETTLIQTMGRAARHPEGKVIMYADKTTESMEKAVKEVSRRRRIQEKYNKENNIIPSAISKEIREWAFASKEKQVAFEMGAVSDINLLEKEMKAAAGILDFERAAVLRDMIKKMKEAKRG